MEGFENLKHFLWRRLGLRAIAIVWTFFLMQISIWQVSADLVQEAAVLLSMKTAWGNEENLRSWSNNTNVCSFWNYVECDSHDVTIIGLSISGTGFAGSNSSIPENISELVNLKNLTLANLALAGIIPSSIGNLKNLTLLDLSSNVLTGPIPDSLGNLTSLMTLNLSSNSLTGQIPTSLGNLTSLLTLNLNHNGLDGTIPISFGSLAQILLLDLSYQNNLSGSVPEQLTSLSNLQSLVLQNNKLSGDIPSGLADLQRLYSLTLQNNILTGSIPEKLSKSLSLSKLDLSKNNLTGPIPGGFGSENVLRYVNLSSNNLSGDIPKNFGDQLQTLDLSHNFLTGGIPQIYVDVPKSLSQLNILNLQDNCLNGTAPNASGLTGWPNFLSSNNVSGNCFDDESTNCKCPSSTVPGHRKTRREFIIIGVVAGSCLLGVTAVLPLVFSMCKCRSKPLKSTSNYKGPVRQYTLLEVYEATENLTTKIGEGGFATVYKAVFKGGITAAVKHFNKKKPLENFEQEVQLLSHLNHRYLVNLIGYCDEKEELMLLYDFMDRGNLFENLHGSRSTVPLTWEERVKILISVARGIEYLHYGTAPPMIHRDIKSANILLSDSGGNTLNAKIADFGLGKHTEMDSYEMMPRAFGDETPLPPPTRVAGTAGYLDPEYLTTSFLSPKSDVYSYGVVLLELITGKRPIFYDTEDGYDRTSLVSWAQRRLDDNVLWAIVDPQLERGSFPEDQLQSVATLARRCVDQYSRNRPTIRDFLKSLGEIFSTETFSSTAEASKEYSASPILNQNLSNLEEFGPDSTGFSKDYYDAHLEFPRCKIEETTETSISMDFCSAQSEMLAKQ